MPASTLGGRDTLGAEQLVDARNSQKRDRRLPVLRLGDTGRNELADRARDAVVERELVQRRKRLQVLFRPRRRGDQEAALAWFAEDRGR